MGRLLPSSRTDRRGGSGYTLLEVLIATMLTCVMVTAVFSVSLTSRRDAGKNDRRLLANQIARTLTSRLANYVSGCCASTGCNGAATPPGCPKPVPSCGSIGGPNTSNGTNKWSLTDPDPTYPIADSQGNAYAFQAGVHTVTGAGLFPSWFANPPYNAQATYTVGNFCPNASPNITSQVKVTWKEPAEWATPLP